MTTHPAASSNTRAGSTVSPTQPLTYGPAQRRGYGFQILSANNMPLFELIYATAEESQQAEADVRAALAHSVSFGLF